MIYTYGYTGTKPEQLRAVVEAKGAMLIDIRFSPRSRVPHWTGAALAVLADQDRYLWCRDLGNLNYKTGDPIQLVNPHRAANLLAPILRRQPVILLCGCADYHTCHRLTAAQYLRDHLGGAVVHLVNRTQN